MNLTSGLKQHYHTLLQIATGMMAVIAGLWLSYEIWRFLWEPDYLGPLPIHPGAIDLKMRFNEVNAWFQGTPVYKTIGSAVYPPASYVIFWLLLGWLSLPYAKLLWLAASLFVVWIFSRQLIRYSLASSPLEKRFIGWLPFAAYATGATIGNGQVIVFVLPLLLAGIWNICHSSIPAIRRKLGNVAILLALVQPTIAAPFFWLIMFVPRTIKPAAIIVMSYVLLTGFALMFQTMGTAKKLDSASSMKSIENWTSHASGGIKAGSVSGGYNNIHTLLTSTGLAKWNIPASLIILLALGIWIFLYRHAEIGLLIGMTAIIARLWIYHRWYNDLLIVLPLVTLFRITHQAHYSSKAKYVATVLFIIGWLVTLAPGGLYLLPSPLDTVWMMAQVVLWLGMLVFLMQQIYTQYTPQFRILNLR